MSFSLLRITLIFTTISSEFMTVFFANFFVVTQFLKFWGQEEGINKPFKPRRRREEDGLAMTTLLFKEIKNSPRSIPAVVQLYGPMVTPGVREGGRMKNHVLAGSVQSWVII